MDLEPQQILIVVCFFWIILYGVSKLLPLKKHGLEIQPIYLVYKTERFNNLLQGIAVKYPSFWHVALNMGVAISLGQMVFAGYVLTSNLFRFIFVPEEAMRVFLILPGITIRLMWFPYLFMAIAVGLITHEVAHGIATCLEKVSIKSAGVIVAFVTLGGFVEPDEEQLEKVSLFSKLRIISAGSLANLATGLLILLLTNLGNLIPSFLQLTMDWLLLIILNLAIFNMMLIYPLDGDAYASVLFKKYAGKHAKKIRIALNIGFLTLLIANLVLTFMRYGFTSI